MFLIIVVLALLFLLLVMATLLLFYKHFDNYTHFVVETVVDLRAWKVVVRSHTSYNGCHGNVDLCRLPLTMYTLPTICSNTMRILRSVLDQLYWTSTSPLQMPCL